MRIAVICSSRTGSSAFMNLVASAYNIKNYSEMFACDPMDFRNKMNVLVETDDYVVKITSTSFLMHKIPFEEFTWDIFDRVICLERRFISRQVSSWLLLSDAQMNGAFESVEVDQYIREALSNMNAIDINDNLLKYIVDDINFYKLELYPFIKNNIHHYHIYHENFEKINKGTQKRLSRVIGKKISEDDLYAIKPSISRLNYSRYVERHNINHKIRKFTDEYTPKEQDFNRSFQ